MSKTDRRTVLGVLASLPLVGWIAKVIEWRCKAVTTSTFKIKTDTGEEIPITVKAAAFEKLTDGKVVGKTSGLLLEIK